jgi:beta-lactamase class A
MSRKLVLLLIFLAFGWIVAIYCLFRLHTNADIKTQNTFEEQQIKYSLLSKRVLQEFPQDLLINFLDLRKDLRSKVSSYGENEFGVYFEYLPTGTSIGVNDRLEYHAASQFKLPVVMAYYHWRERTNNMQDPVITIQKEDLNSEFGDLWKKGEGHKIKLSEAVKLAIEDSDNTAAHLVARYLEAEDFEAVYEGLDIEFETDASGAILSAKNYSSILKALYFSSVLSKDSSQEILDLLSKTKFPDKLEAGVKPGVIVAHKIGNFSDSEGNEAYTDCGIVYVPKRPYVLCMLSVGNEDKARIRMREISRIVYNFVSSE